MIERRGRFRFLNEAFFLFRGLAQMLRQKLEGDEAVEFGVLRLVNSAHAAGAEFFEDLVV